MPSHFLRIFGAEKFAQSGGCLSDKLSYLISAAVILKILAFVFLNYDDLALSLNYGSFVLLTLAYVLCFTSLIKDIKGIFIFAYIGCVIAMLYLHSTILGVEIELTSLVLFPLIISAFYILPIRLLSKGKLDFVLSSVGMAIVAKILLNFSVLYLIISGYFFSDKDSLQIYFGKMADDIVSYDSFSIIKLYEKSLIAMPLILYLSPASRLAQYILVCILILGCAATLTISFYVTLVIIAVLFVYRDLLVGRYMHVIACVFMAGVFLALFSLDIFSLFAEKGTSISVKANQFAELLSFENLLGLGVGSSNVPTLQLGDVFIENSYILIYYWLGFLSVVIFIKIFYFFLISIKNINLSRRGFLCAATIISILLNSGSNAYIFSGGVMVIFIVCVVRFDFNWKFI
jgi:hypothetical protein